MEASQTPGQDPEEQVEDPAASEGSGEDAQPGDQGEQVAEGGSSFDPDSPVRTSAPPPEAQSGTPGQTPGGVNDPDNASGATEGGQSPQGPDEGHNQGGTEAGTSDNAQTGEDAPLSDAADQGGAERV